MPRPSERILAVPAAILVAAAAWPVSSLVARAGLDASWRVALHLAWLRDVHFGPQFVWTYGPLGFLGFPLAVSGQTLLASFAFVAVAEVVLAYLLIRRGRRAAGPLLALPVAYLMLATPVQPPDLLLLVVLGLALWALEDQGAGRWLPLAGAVAGLAALTKTNTGAAAIGIVVVASAALAACGRRRALGCIAVAVAVFLLGWIATGNSVADLPAWMRLSASLVSGYSTAMQYEHPGLHDEYVFAAAAAALFLLAVAVRARRLGPLRGGATFLAAAGFAFAFFKEGFVRHDAAHSSSFFAALAIGSVLAASRDASRWLAAAAVVVALVALQRSHELSYHPVAAADRAASQLGDVATTAGRRRLVDASRTSQRRSYDVPARILHDLAGQTTHVDPYDTAVVSAYGLAWRPLPVLQAYSAYTSALDERNAAFLGSPAAPARILRLETPELVNGRSPEVEAPAEFRALVCDYRQADVTGEWQVLTRMTRSRCGAERSLGAVSATSDEPVAVPQGRPDELVFARVWTPTPFADAVRGLVFKPRVPGISLNGGPFVQLAPSVGPDGIVLHMPGSAGWSPRFGGALDSRTIAVGSLGGPVRIEFDAVSVRGRVTIPRGEKPPAHLPHYVLGAAVARGGGFVDYAFERGPFLVLQGWAANAAAGVPARSILVFADGKLVFSGPPNTARPDVARALGHPALARSGFTILVPDAAVRSRGARLHVRVVALVGGAELELAYAPGYGWR